MIASSWQRAAGRVPWRLLPAALAMVVAVATPLPAAAPSLLPLPAHGAKRMAQSVGMSEGVPHEAFEDFTGYEKWKVIEAVVAKDGETARIRLRHPANDRVIAVLQYRLVSSTVTEER